MMNVVEKRSNLVMPTHYVELDSEEMSYVDAGGRIKITVSCTLGGFAWGMMAGSVTGFISGFFAGFASKIGAMGGIVGTIAGGVIGGIAGLVVSSFVNKLLYGGSGAKSITIIDCWVPFVNFKKDIDIGEKLGAAIGGFGGGCIGGAMATATGYALGFAS